MTSFTVKSTAETIAMTDLEYRLYLVEYNLELARLALTRGDVKTAARLNADATGKMERIKGDYP